MFGWKLSGVFMYNYFQNCTLVVVLVSKLDFRGQFSVKSIDTEHKRSLKYQNGTSDVTSDSKKDSIGYLVLKLDTRGLFRTKTEL